MNVKEYISALCSSLGAIKENDINEVVDLLETIYDERKTIFLCGNGGSAAAASHMTNDLAKLTIIKGRTRVRVISLVDNVPLLTAWANDSKYEDCFVEQLKNLYRPGDVLIGISGSGNSENVLKAVKYTNENEGITIGLTGCGGGKLAKLTQKSIVVPCDNMQRVEDIHLVICHMVSTLFAQRLKETAKE